jgi:hypothetical protein
MTNEQFKRSDFLAAAKDLINTMGLKDDKGKPLPIDAKSNVAQLTKFILSATEEIDPGSDEFTPETLAILAHVGYTGFGPAEETETDIEPKAALPEKKAESKPKEDLAEDADWKEPEPAEPLTLQQQVAAAKRLADLKDLVTGNLEFKKLVPKLKSYMGLGGPRELKKDMQKIVGVPEVAVKATGTGVGRKKGTSEEVQARRQATEAMVAAGKFTARQIAEKISADFDMKMSSIITDLADGKNPKYNKFTNLIKTNEGGLLSF